MTLTLDLLPELAAAFLLVFARLGAVVMLMPGYGEQFFPARFRLALALLVTLVMLPLVRERFGAIPREIPPLLLLLVAEIATGLFIGLAIRLVSGTLATAGTLIAQQTGLAFVTQLDPTQGGQSVLLANFMTLTGIAIVFALDLHHAVLAAIHDSYALFPPGQVLPVGDVAETALAIFLRSFALAVQIAAPFLVLGLVFQVALGLLSRMMPQLQIMFLATPVQLVAGFLLLGAVLATAMAWYGTAVEEAVGRFLQR